MYVCVFVIGDCRQHSCANREELILLLERKCDTLYGEYGVIVFLYSLLLTKVSQILTIMSKSISVWITLEHTV